MWIPRVGLAEQERRWSSRQIADAWPAAARLRQRQNPRDQPPPSFVLFASFATGAGLVCAGLVAGRCGLPGAGRVITGCGFGCGRATGGCGFGCGRVTGGRGFGGGRVIGGLGLGGGRVTGGFGFGGGRVMGGFGWGGRL